ncbi:response regulator [Flavobacteriaceae bacterium R38]|nr:response regulator [Flavobacteriaceae bacterium R38]
MKVLYVGKDSAFTDQSIEEHNVSYITKNNGLEAIKVLQTDKDIDVIISEYDLPGNNGLFFFDKVRENQSLPTLPFILLVEEFNELIYKEAFTVGVNDYFVLNTTSKTQIINRAKSLCDQEIIKLPKDVDLNVEPIADLNVEPIKYKIPFSKRVFDIFAASMILILLSPILLITILAIRLESKGKVYYIAKRVGRKTFDFYKLRSMRSGADKLLKELAETKNQYNNTEVESTIQMDETCPRCKMLPKGVYCSPLKYEGTEKICDYMYNHQKEQIQNNNSSFIKIVDDPRITRIGKIIRNTSIDELPQLINVIKGDMSLVGNRPLPVYEAELLTKDQMSKRFLAPAGITGLWQVELRGKGGDMSEEERIALDNKYADHFTGNNYSFWFDIKILLRTVPALLQKSTV